MAETPSLLRRKPTSTAAYAPELNPAGTAATDPLLRQYTSQTNAPQPVIEKTFDPRSPNSPLRTPAPAMPAGPTAAPAPAVDPALANERVATFSERMQNLKGADPTKAAQVLRGEVPAAGGAGGGNTIPPTGGSGAPPEGSGPRSWFQKGKDFFSGGGEPAAPSSFGSKAMSAGKNAAKAGGLVSGVFETATAAMDPKVRAFMTDSDVSIADKARLIADRGLRVAGSAAGSFLGGAAGSVVPVAGTAVGATAGGMAGYALGDAAMDDPMQKYSKYATPKPVAASPQGNATGPTAAEQAKVQQLPPRELLDKTNPAEAKRVANGVRSGDIRLADLKEGEGYVVSSSGKVTKINPSAGDGFRQTTVTTERPPQVQPRETAADILNGSRGKGYGDIMFGLAGHVAGQKETARKERLGENARQADMQNDTLRRGQDIAAEGHRLTAQTARDRLAYDAAKERRAANEKITEKIFTTADKDGKPVVDAKGQAEYVKGVQNAMRAAGMKGDYMDLPQEAQSKILQHMEVKKIADADSDGYLASLNANTKTSSNPFDYMAVERLESAAGPLVRLRNGKVMYEKDYVGGGGLFFKDPVDVFKQSDMNADIASAQSQGFRVPDDRRVQWGK